MALVRDADSVELKLTVADEDRRSAVALGIDPLAARLRLIFFFDTPALALDSAGVVVRARRSQGAIQSREFLAARGIDLAGQQATKTRTALSYFAGLAD
jgi:hypothetical protein